MKIIAMMLFLVISAMLPGPVAAQTQAQKKTAAAATDKGWPRRFAVEGTSFVVYQPHIEEWVDNRMEARSAFSVTEGETRQPSYGVMWFHARTDIDKVNRLVTFSEVEVTRVNFPTAMDRVSLFQTLLQSRVQRSVEVISFDHLMSDMAINQASASAAAYEVKNEPPQIIFSTRPAVLITIDGEQEFRPAEPEQPSCVLVLFRGSFDWLP